MKKHLAAIGAAWIALALCGCASVEVFSDAALTERTGIPFYTAKPYLLVARTGAKDKPVEVSIIYVPDLSHPYYARISSGLGSSDTTLSFTNSILTSVGQKQDMQLDELLTSVGGLQQALANAAQTRRETALLGNESAPDYAATAASLKMLSSDIRRQIDAARAADIMTTSELQTLDQVARITSSASDRLADPSTAESQLATIIVDLENVAKSWDNQVAPASSTTSGPEVSIRRQVAALRTQLKAAIDALKPKEGDPPTFALYEFFVDDGKVTLRLVAPN